MAGDRYLRSEVDKEDRSLDWEEKANGRERERDRDRDREREREYFLLLLTRPRLGKGNLLTDTLAG